MIILVLLCRIKYCLIIYSNSFWNAATTLTSWHLLVTFCSLHVALWMKLFEHKPFDPRAVMGFGVLNGISIGLLNLSLGFNSVGFYQVKFHSSSCYLWSRIFCWLEWTRLSSSGYLTWQLFQENFSTPLCSRIHKIIIKDILF